MCGRGGSSRALAVVSFQSSWGGRAPSLASTASSCVAPSWCLDHRMLRSVAWVVAVAARPQVRQPSSSLPAPRPFFAIPLPFAPRGWRGAPTGCDASPARRRSAQPMTDRVSHSIEELPVCRVSPGVRGRSVPRDLGAPERCSSVERRAGPTKPILAGAGGGRALPSSAFHSCSSICSAKLGCTRLRCTDHSVEFIPRPTENTHFHDMRPNSTP